MSFISFLVYTLSSFIIIVRSQNVILYAQDVNINGCFNRNNALTWCGCKNNSIMVGIYRENTPNKDDQVLTKYLSKVKCAIPTRMVIDNCYDKNIRSKWEVSGANATCDNGFFMQSIGTFDGKNGDKDRGLNDWEMIKCCNYSSIDGRMFDINESIVNEWDTCIGHAGWCEVSGNSLMFGIGRSRGGNDLTDLHYAYSRRISWITTNQPSLSPSNVPTKAPLHTTKLPTNTPSINPTRLPTNGPTIIVYNISSTNDSSVNITTTKYLISNKGTNETILMIFIIISILICIGCIILGIYIVQGCINKDDNEDMTSNIDENIILKTPISAHPSIYDGVYGNSEENIITNGNSNHNISDNNINEQKSLSNNNIQNNGVIIITPFMETPQGLMKNISNQDNIAIKGQ